MKLKESVTTTSLVSHLLLPLLYEIMDKSWGETRKNRNVLTKMFTLVFDNP